MQAWEIVTDWADGVYLNYSGAPWGVLQVHGQPTQVCYTRLNEKKFAGIGDSKDLLSRALKLVIQNITGSAANIECMALADVIAANSTLRDLRKFFASIP